MLLRQEMHSWDFQRLQAELAATHAWLPGHVSFNRDIGQWIEKIHNLRVLQSEAARWEWKWVAAEWRVRWSETCEKQSYFLLHYISPYMTTTPSQRRYSKKVMVVSISQLLFPLVPSTVLMPIVFVHFSSNWNMPVLDWPHTSIPGGPIRREINKSHVLPVYP